MAIRVLILDYDGAAMQNAARVLRLQGFEVLTVDNADKALAHVRERAPDLVLTEIVMHGKDGIECLLEIKRIAPQTKVVAMSGGHGMLTNEYVLYLAQRLGADGTLAKPFTDEELSSAVRGALDDPAAGAS